jgi:hypothetical protein
VEAHVEILQRFNETLATGVPGLGSRTRVPGAWDWLCAVREGGLMLWVEHWNIRLSFSHVKRLRRTKQHVELQVVLPV